MKEEKDKKVYCTNMDEDDPIIEKFLKEYLKEKSDGAKVQKNDDLLVNFDITYADGQSKSYTCGNESEVFGNIQEEYHEDTQCEQESKEKYNHLNETNSYDIESEIGKWTNCVDEWCECSNKKEEKENIKKETIKKEECEGKITVYSILSLGNSTTLKGVTINLYKINGVNPELAYTKVTDDNGVAVFENVKPGNYRIIQLIDKRYFNKPVYMTWNEVNITESNKEYVLYVLNTLKNYRKN